MSGITSIEWTDRSWNPITGCTRVTSGCDNCYAFALHDMRHEAHKQGMKMAPQYHKPFSEIQLLPQRLEDPLKWQKSSKIFVNSMSDLFHSQVPERYIRLRNLGPQLNWPENVWMGVSIETDDLTPRANALREIPAAVKFVSCEPLLGPLPSLNLEGLDWVIVGGESGKNARPMDMDWVRDIRDRCAASDVAFFFKQIGGRTPKAGGRELD